MTRQEHLDWCKQRALGELHYEGYSSEQAIRNAITSMGSDLRKHPETEKHSGLALGMLMLVGGQFKTKADVEKFIGGFN